MEPIFLEPVFKDYIWGGTKLKTYFNKESDIDTVAESWEISTNENGKSTIKGADKTLFDLFEDKQLRKQIFGLKTMELKKFPLLIKFIDANSNLSVQVHPNDEYAKKYENGTGKTEMWYIIDCSENAQIICGMKENVKQSEIENIIKEGRIKENLNYIDIQPGDCIFIPSGTIHALLGNTLLCEVQQNSDLTYRVYDWDRIGKDGKQRELHIEKSIDVINVNNKPIINRTAKNSKENINIVKSEFFKSDLIKVKSDYKDISDKDTFYTINIIKGKGTIIANNKEYNIKKGDSFIIPSELGQYQIIGNMEIIKSYI